MHYFLPLSPDNIIFRANKYLQNNYMSQEDKICLITGASSGIGHAIAKALNTKGYKLILSPRREDSPFGIYQSCWLGHGTRVR
jgi:hypothetical protein